MIAKKMKIDVYWSWPIKFFSVKRSDLGRMLELVFERVKR